MVIPSINRRDFASAASQIKKAESFARRIHIDVADGKFTENISWGNPAELQSLETKLEVEVHLMVQEPERQIESWLKVGVKRVIVQLQTIHNPEFLIEIAAKYGAEIMLSLDTHTSVEQAAPYFSSFKLFQVLAVTPGVSGQRFNVSSLEKIKLLREKVPDATIEVDGGITPETAVLSKKAGADALVSASYIFSHPNPGFAYEQLSKI